MLHKCISFILALLIALPLSASTLPVEVENHTTLIPLRFLCDLLDYNLTWQNDTSPIIIEKGSKVLKLTLNSKEASLNHIPFSLPTTIKKIDGTVMVPLRAVAEKLDATILFENNIVYLSDGIHYWVWELNDGVTSIKSTLPQTFFTQNRIVINSLATVSNLLNLTVADLNIYFPGHIKIPGTSHYIAYLDADTPYESTLTFYYDEQSSKPYCITIGQSMNPFMEVFGFNYITPPTLNYLNEQFGRYLFSDTTNNSSSYLYAIGSHSVNFAFSNGINPKLQYIDLYP